MRGLYPILHIYMYLPQVWKGEAVVSTWERGGKAAEGKEWLTRQKPEGAPIESFVHCIHTPWPVRLHVIASYLL